jgi:O-glycosyl hydrolase
MTRINSRLLASGLAAFLITACGDGGSPLTNIVGPEAVARVEVSPLRLDLQPGQSGQITASMYDADGVALSGRAVSFSVADATIATVSSTGRVTAQTVGSTTVTATSEGKSASANVVVTQTTPVPGGNVVDVAPSTTYQTMTGWQALTQNGWEECDQTAFPIYRNQLHDRAANELGINRMTIMVRSGAEITRDWFGDYKRGVIDYATYRASWFVPVNDNADPLAADANRFFWGYVDGQVDNSIQPMRQRLAARGEKLYIVLQYVDFVQGQTKPFQPMKVPEEYAELVTETFKHLRQKYNIVPDAFELVLEPEHTPYYAPDLGRAMVAAVNRLKASGFTPAIIAPSTTSMANASTWYDEMIQVPGARGLITELAYHRYVAVSLSALQAIGQRTQRDGIKSSMLEHIGSGIDALYDDLTIGMASAWQQFALAYCGQKDNPANGGVYYQINQTDPSNPRINITDHSRLLRQVFNFVRFGAVRIGASTGNTAVLRPLAFRNVNGKYVVVVRTTGGAALTVRGLPAGMYGINYGTSSGAWNVDQADVSVPSGGTVQASIPSSGVVTIYGR